MGNGVSSPSLPPVLSKAEVKQLAGQLYHEDLFLDIANDDDTMSRQQFERCVALAQRNLLRYVVVPRHSENGTREARLSAAEWSLKGAALRDAGDMLGAAVAAHRAFIAMPDSRRCLEWLRALLANGMPPGRLVNLAEGFCSIYPGSAGLQEVQTNARKKVPQPFEEVEDQMYPLTEEERQRVEVAIEELHSPREAHDLDPGEYAAVARRAKVRMPDDVAAYLRDQVICTYVGARTQQTIFWTRKDSNMPGLAREDTLFRNHADDLIRLLQKEYPNSLKWFEKDYPTIHTDLTDFRIELMSVKLVFALYNTVRKAIARVDAAATEKDQGTEPSEHSQTVVQIPRRALVQLFFFFGVVGEHLYSQTRDWKDHEKFLQEWPDKQSLAKFMKVKYTAMADRRELSEEESGVSTTVPSVGRFAEVLLDKDAQAAGVALAETTVST